MILFQGLIFIGLILLDVLVGVDVVATVSTAGDDKKDVSYPAFCIDVVYAFFCVSDIVAYADVADAFALSSIAFGDCAQPHVPADEPQVIASYCA